MTAKISIHALVKRATLAKRQRNSCRPISIHALVKRATAYIAGIRIMEVYFNPRPREEGDSFFSVISVRSSSISIHALVKRATTVRSDRTSDL